MTNAELKEQFVDIAKTYIHREGIDDLLDFLEDTDFYTAPSSTKYHGAHEGGLLVHSLTVHDCMEKLTFVFDDILGFREGVEESVAIVALFHDLCKIGCYKTEMKNVKNKETGVWEQKPSYYFSEDMPLGSHGGKSCWMVQKFMDLSAKEAAAITAHMGAFENENCSKTYEKYPLAWLLHVADEMATFIYKE